MARFVRPNSDTYEKRRREEAKRAKRVAKLERRRGDGKAEGEPDASAGDTGFEADLDHVLAKNAELYRRLGS